MRSFTGQCPHAHEMDFSNSAPWDHEENEKVACWARAGTQMTMILSQVSKLIHQTFQTHRKQIHERAVSANARDNYLPFVSLLDVFVRQGIRAQRVSPIINAKYTTRKSFFHDGQHQEDISVRIPILSRSERHTPHDVASRVHQAHITISVAQT